MDIFVFYSAHAGDGAESENGLSILNLEGMPPTERTRWVEFLSYILALVYHARGRDEHPELREVVDRSVQIDPHRKEYKKMGQTIAEMYIEKGRLEGEEKGRLEGKLSGKLEASRAVLLRLLRKRFKKVPRKAAAHIAATTNLEDLDLWLENFVDAKTLAEVGIPLD